MVEYKVGFVSNVLLPVIATLFTNNLPGIYIISADVPITIWLELLTCALYPMAVEKDNVFTEDDVFDPINVLFVPEDRFYHYYILHLYHSIHFVKKLN